MSHQPHSLVNSVKEFTAYIILCNISEDFKTLKSGVVTTEVCVKNTLAGGGTLKEILFGLFEKISIFLQHGRRVKIVTRKLLLIPEQCPLFLCIHVQSTVNYPSLGSLPVGWLVAPQAQRQWAWTLEGLFSSQPAAVRNTAHSFQDQSCQIWLLQGYLDASVWIPPQLGWVCEFVEAVHRASLDVMLHPSSYAHSGIGWFVDSSWLQFRAKSPIETLSLFDPDITPCTIHPKKSYSIPSPAITKSQPSLFHTSPLPNSSLQKNIPRT